ncbi:preprotein translocase subunit SecG [Mycoplasmatota bacterium]|nr:preprotein translocase subunit SecG [Mycoplasmatota bacterium]
MNFLDWFLLIDAMIVITFVALQESKGGLGEALTGANTELFKNQKERGVELFLSRGTLVSVIIFIVLAVLTKQF